jgi:hypothetical protein
MNLYIEYEVYGQHKTFTQWRSQDFEVGGYMASAEREPIWGFGGRADPAPGQGAKLS